MRILKIYIVTLVMISVTGAPGRAGDGSITKNFREGIELSNRGEHEKAAELLRKVIYADPYNSGAHLALGISLINIKNPEEALTYITRASELDPENRKAVFILARLYERNEEIGRAIEAWERYLSLNPDAKRAQKAKKHLERLRERE